MTARDMFEKLGNAGTGGGYKWQQKKIIKMQ